MPHLTYCKLVTYSSDLDSAADEAVQGSRSTLWLLHRQCCYLQAFRIHLVKVPESRYNHTPPRWHYCPLVQYQTSILIHILWNNLRLTVQHFGFSYKNNHQWSPHASKQHHILVHVQKAYKTRLGPAPQNTVTVMHNIKHEFRIQAVVMVTCIEQTCKIQCGQLGQLSKHTTQHLDPFITNVTPCHHSHQSK